MDKNDDDGGYNSDDVPNRMDARTPNPLALENFNLSPEVVCALQKKGIDALFAIQAQTLDTAMSGKDIVGKSKNWMRENISVRFADRRTD